MTTDATIRKKIKETRLFSDSQKVELLVVLPDASDEDKTKLLAGIEAFDTDYARAVKQGTQKIKSVLGHATKDMTDEEKIAFDQDLVVNVGLRNIAVLVGGLGFFITLISIGIRGKKGRARKTVTQKPAET